MYKIILLIKFLLVSFSIAKITSNVTATFFPTNNNKTDVEDNEIGNNEIIEDTCKVSVLPPKPSSMCCGVDLSSSNRIIGGTPTGINQYPWLAAIFDKSRDTGNLVLGCGGALISSLYVLTAAHCVVDNGDGYEPYSVVLGDHDLDHDGPDCVIMRGRKICSDGEITIGIAMTVPHALYRLHESKAHDIALIKLATMVPYTDGIRPICLPTFDINKSSLNNIWLYAAGWGTMQQEWKDDDFVNTLSNVKRHVHVPFVNNQKCDQVVIAHEITNSQVCAGGLNKSVCMGDSGGPLMFNNGGQFEATGLVSFGFGDPCGQEDKPDVYTNVFKYKEWIFNVINKGMA